MTDRGIFSILQYREVLTNLIKADLKLRYRRTALGYTWTLLYPLMTMLIMAIVFSAQLGFQSRRDYLLYVFAGLLPWNFLISALWGAGNSIIAHEDLLKKIYLPKYLFPIAVTMARFYDYLFNFVALFGIIMLTVVSFYPGALPFTAGVLAFLPLAIVPLFLFMIGITMAVSAVNVYLRDTTHLMSVIMQLGFYLTPIIYREQSLPADFRFILLLNPMTHIIRPFQDILYAGVIPSADHLLASVGLSLASVALGYVIFARLERRLIFRL
jgi:ABC-2 type transport system permease protein/lipopolysaccharide transport system permease protein